MMKQSKRDAVVGDLSLEYFAKWISAGWKVASVEWVREAENEEQPTEEAMSGVSTSALVPYGLRVAGSGTIEENPLEATVLLNILDQIVKEKRIQEIAAELNLLGYVTREGHQWSASHVFNLLPRLVEVGPVLLKSAAWQKRAATRGGSETIN